MEHQVVAGSGKPITLESLDFEFIDPCAVPHVAVYNIVGLNQCQKLEDTLQYNDELLSKGRSRIVHRRVHDEIVVKNCEDSSDLCGQSKLALIEKFSKELVDKNTADVGSTNEFEEKY